MVVFVKMKGNKKKEWNKYLQLEKKQKMFGTWKWRWYQLKLERSEQSPKIL